MENKKIKLFVDAHSLDKGYQGTYTFIRQLYSEFLPAHPHIEVYMGTSRPERIRQLFPSLPPSRILPYNRYGPGILRLLTDIPFYLKKYAFDFAHFQYLAPVPFAGCRYIVTLHDITFVDFPAEFSWIYRKSRKLLFGRSIRSAAIKTTVSDYSRNRIADVYDIDPVRVEVIPNGISAVFYHAQDRALAAGIIKEKYGISNFMLYVSRLEKRKNHEFLLDVYLELKLYREGIALVFIGRETEHLISLHRKIGRMTEIQRQHFYFLNDIPETDLAAFYTACRLFVYPSKAEGFGIPPLEAAACGAPVLCSSATAMKSFTFFEPWCFNPDEPADFKQKLVQMLRQPPPAQKLKELAKYVRSNYQWRSSSTKLYNLLVHE